MKRKMQFPKEVKRIMRKLEISKEEEEALCELLADSFIQKPLNMKEIGLKLKEFMSTMRSNEI